VANGQAFLASLDEAMAARRWNDADQMMSEVLRAAPPWLAAQEDAVAWRQIRIAHERNDLQQMVVLARIRLDKDRLETSRVLGLAKECQAAGESSVAIALAREIVRMVPEFREGATYLASLETAPAPAAPVRRPAPAAAPVLAEPAAPAVDLSDANAFLAKLDEVMAAQHWDDAAQMVRALRHAPPLWLEGEEDGLTWREILIAQARNDPLQVLTLARQRLNAGRLQAVRVLALAKEYQASGEPAMALALAREITQKVPEYRDGARFLLELQMAQDKAARPSSINPLEMKEGSERSEPAR
jgi:hypothetical protein